MLALWDATREYRIYILSRSTYDDILMKDWPILRSDLGPQLVSSFSQLLFVILKVIVDSN